jgi:hypothetical protein
MRNIKKEITEKEALGTSTGFVNYRNRIGYFGFKEANFLVGPGKYKFKQVLPWGYVVERIVGQGYEM